MNLGTLSQGLQRKIPRELQYKLLEIIDEINGKPDYSSGVTLDSGDAIFDSIGVGVTTALRPVHIYADATDEIDGSVMLVQGIARSVTDTHSQHAIFGNLYVDPPSAATNLDYTSILGFTQSPSGLVIGNSILKGIYGAAFYEPPSTNIIARTAGLWGTSWNESNGQIYEAINVGGQAYNGPGTIHFLFDFFAQAPDNAGTITNHYAYYAEQHDEATNNWILYSPGTTQSYHAGPFGFGIATPARNVHSESTTEPQIRASYDDDNYAELAVDSSGNLTVSFIGQMFIPGAYANDMNGDTYRDLLINDSGELGYDSSTKRFKTNIEDLDDVAWLHDLRPVSYQPVKNPHKRKLGLVAEEVDEIMPSLVARGHSFDPYSGDFGASPDGVQYRDLIVPLLREVQNLRQEVELLKAA